MSTDTQDNDLAELSDATAHESALPPETDSKSADLSTDAPAENWQDKLAEQMTASSQERTTEKSEDAESDAGVIKPEMAKEESEELDDDSDNVALKEKTQKKFEKLKKKHEADLQEIRPYAEMGQALYAQMVDYEVDATVMDEGVQLYLELHSPKTTDERRLEVAAILRQKAAEVDGLAIDTAKAAPPLPAAFQKRVDAGELTEELARELWQETYSTGPKVVKRPAAPKPAPKPTVQVTEAQTKVYKDFETDIATRYGAQAPLVIDAVFREANNVAKVWGFNLADHPDGKVLNNLFAEARARVEAAIQKPKATQPGSKPALPSQSRRTPSSTNKNTDWREELAASIAANG